MSLEKMIPILFEMGFIAFVVLIIGNIRYENGRIDQCHELGKYHTQEGKCLDCEETGRLFINGFCEEPTPLMDYETQKNQFLGFKNQNGTIL